MIELEIIVTLPGTFILIRREELQTDGVFVYIVPQAVVKQTKQQVTSCILA